MVRLHKCTSPVDRTPNTEESKNESSHPSSEPESVVKSHKGSSPPDTMSGRPSSSHWDHSALGSSWSPPGNKSSPPGSPRSRQNIEAETGKTELANGTGHVTHHHDSHDPDIQQSVEPTEIYKCRPSYLGVVHPISLLLLVQACLTNHSF